MLVVCVAHCAAINGRCCDVIARNSMQKKHCSRTFVCFMSYFNDFIMSILVSTGSGLVLSHQDFIEKIYSCVEYDGSTYSLEYKPEMFMINTPFKTNLEALKHAAAESDEKSVRNRKRKRPSCNSSEIAQRVQNQAKSLISSAQEKGFLSCVVTSEDIGDNNSEARTFTDEVLKTAGKASLPSTFNGANGTPIARLELFGNHRFVFPNDCRFFCDDVLKMKERTEELGNFDLIVIDPPWWNKYIRRKRARNDNDGYKMLSTDDLLEIPVAKLLNPGALVAVWCTNSEKHINDLQNILMPAWGVKHLASWCWLKVTNSGEPICPYMPPPGKQPFEQILFGVERNALETNRSFPCPEDGLLVISVPSAIHSHKPPLLDALRKYLPAKPKCLEIFARSLLPGCTSWGLEVIRLQHQSFFNKRKI